MAQPPAKSWTPAAPVKHESTVSLMLTVSNLPTEALVLNNKVYVHPEDGKALGYTVEGKPLVAITAGSPQPIVYGLGTHEAVVKGTIGMNAFQRTLIGVKDLGKSIEVKPFSIKQGTPICAIIHVTAELANSKIKRMVEEDALIKVFLDLAKELSVVQTGQTFAARCQDGTYKLTVDGIEVPTDARNLEEKLQVGKWGQVIDATVADISIKPSPMLDIKKSANSFRQNIIKQNWNFEDLGIGGLDNEFQQIFRRAFTSRIFPRKEIEELGIQHVKGILLYGPPGTGKTLIARQIGKMLQGKEPKIVNGPEILNKYVGQSEENIRNLFADAEAEYKEKGDDSDLHIIIFDEIDAICKQRGSVNSGTGVHDTVVNQLLAKMDPVAQLNNILVIGMTNRKDMIDEALLRPGRLEVHIEIGLPDEPGRERIFEIHTSQMRKANRLHQDVDLKKLAANTKNFSGAEIAGVVRSAASCALTRCLEVGTGAPKIKKDIQVIVTMADFEKALSEVTPPAFGVSNKEMGRFIDAPLVSYGHIFDKTIEQIKTLIHQLKTSDRTKFMSVLLEGPNGTGKTTMAAKLALKSDIPYVKMISPEQYVGDSEAYKANSIRKVFDDAYKSSVSVIVLDDIERLIEYVPIGPRFSASLTSMILVLCKKLPTYENHRLLVLATTSNLPLMKQMQITNSFNAIVHVSQLHTKEEVETALQSVMDQKQDAEEFQAVMENVPLPIGIKQLLMLVEMARQSGTITPSVLQTCIEAMNLETNKYDFSVEP